MHRMLLLYPEIYRKWSNLPSWRPFVKRKQSNVAMPSCVAIHNMKEYGSDMCDVQELFGFLECNVQVVNTAQIGKYDRLSKKARLLKVELRSVLDKNAILQVSKYLKDDLPTPKIFIIKWLQLDELKELKVIQTRCRELDNKTPVLKIGRKPYVVISDRFMERKIMGSLRPFRSSPYDPSGSSEDKKIASNLSSSSSTVTIQSDSVATNAKLVTTPPFASATQSKN